jgi:glycerophosphoryl diester phosphodiesterase
MMQTQYVEAYSRFYPSKIEVASSGNANSESYILIDHAKLRATKGVMLGIIDPVRNVIKHQQSYNIMDFPQTLEDLLQILQDLRKEDIVIVLTHGKTILPKPLIATLESLGAEDIDTLEEGQPYILIAKLGNDVFVEKTGEPGTTIIKNFSISDGERDVKRIKKLWNESLIAIQSASFKKGASFVKFNDIEIARIRRGLNLIVIDDATKTVKESPSFDTFAKEKDIRQLQTTIQDIEHGDVLILVGHDSVTGGPVGAKLPDYLVSTLESLGAMYANEIRFRNPYIFVTRIGSDFRIERFSHTEDVIHVELIPHEVETLFPSIPQSQRQKRLPLVAHAGGGINGDTYTNSLEALSANIQKGYTFFEIDLSLTSDGIPVCIHDWEESYTRSFGIASPPKIPDFQEFIQVKNSHSQYDKCTVWTLIEWLRVHPQATLITDSKHDNIKILQFIKEHFPEFRERIIPQIYQPEEYQILRKMGYKRIIWTLYQYDGSDQELLSNAQKMVLFAVTLPKHRVTSELVLGLNKLHIPSYVHTINSLEEAKVYFRLGINSLYTDFITGEILDEIR